MKFLILTIFYLQNGNFIGFELIATITGEQEGDFRDSHIPGGRHKWSLCTQKGGLLIWGETTVLSSDLAHREYSRAPPKKFFAFLNLKVHPPPPLKSVCI